LCEGRLAGHKRQALHCSSNMGVVKWIFLKEASRKWVLDGSGNDKAELHSGKNRRRKVAHRHKAHIRLWPATAAGRSGKLYLACKGKQVQKCLHSW